MGVDRGKRPHLYWALIDFIADNPKNIEAIPDMVIECEKRALAKVALKEFMAASPENSDAVHDMIMKAALDASIRGMSEGLKFHREEMARLRRRHHLSEPRHGAG